MLQLTVATHVQVTDKVILLCQSMISLADLSKITDRRSYTKPKLGSFCHNGLALPQQALESTLLLCPGASLVTLKSDNELELFWVRAFQQCREHSGKTQSTRSPWRR